MSDRYKNEEVTIVYSGGQDSTLATVLMCEQFKKVHLLTYVHSLSIHPEKVMINVKKLEDIFGRDRIVHKFIPIDELHKKIYTSRYLHDLKRYKTFVTGCFCLACRLGMNTRTILYNIENGIHFACDGSSRSSFGLSQMEWIVKEMKKFYKEYDINFDTPVYNIFNSNLELFKLGLKKGYNLFGTQSTQGICSGPNFHGFYSRFYYFPLHGKEAYKRASIEYLRDKMDFCRKYIEDYLNKEI